MKKLLNVFLTLVAFLPLVSYAESYQTTAIRVVQGSPGDCPLTSGEIYYVESFQNSAAFMFSVAQMLCPGARLHTSGTTVRFLGPTKGDLYSLSPVDFVKHDIPPSRTCSTVRGSTISDYHSSEQPYCANLGSSGGANPQPLLCIATCQVCITNSNGSYPFTVTAQSCSAPTGPDGGTGDGGGDDSGGDTGGGDTGGGDSGGNPGGGNSGGDTGGGNSGGNTGGGTTPAPPPVVTVNIGGSFSSPSGVTNVNLSFEQDHSPITTRIDQTNQLLTQTNTGINQLNDTQKATNQLLTQTNTKLDGIAQGQANTNQLLTGLTDAVTGLNTGLGGINDALTSGTLTEGANAANDVNLPTDNQNDAAYQSVISAVSSEQLDSFSNLADNISGFDSIPQLFNFAASNCAPLPFGKHILDICSYAQTSRFLLNWVFIILLVIFLSRSIVSDLKNLKVS